MRCDAQSQIAQVIQREGAGHELPTPVHQVENSRSKHRALLSLTSLHFPKKSNNNIAVRFFTDTHTGSLCKSKEKKKSHGSGVTFYLFPYICVPKKDQEEEGGCLLYLWGSLSFPFPTPSPDTDGRRVPSYSPFFFFFLFLYNYISIPTRSVNMHPRRDERRYQTEKNYL